MPDDKDFELDDLDSFSFEDLPNDSELGASLEDPPASDEFGVWVKGDVEEMDAPAMGAAADGPLADDDFLSKEELANLDDQFDFVTVDEPQEGETLDDPDMDLPS